MAPTIIVRDNSRPFPFCPFWTIICDLLTQQAGRPDVQILEGIDGIKKNYQESHQYDELIFWSDIDQLARLLGKDFDIELDYHQKNNIKIRDIVGDTPFGRRYARKQNKYTPRHQTKILKDITFANDNMIYGNTFVIFSIQKENIFAVKIVSHAITETYRRIFEKLWKSI